MTVLCLLVGAILGSVVIYTVRPASFSSLRDLKLASYSSANSSTCLFTERSAGTNFEQINTAKLKSLNPTHTAKTTAKSCADDDCS